MPQPSNENVMPYIAFRDGRITFALLCPRCKAEGEFGIMPETKAVIPCPNECGAYFMLRWPSSLFNRPFLEHVFEANR
jgi:hypothetical protein